MKVVQIVVVIHSGLTSEQLGGACVKFHISSLLKGKASINFLISEVISIV